VSCEVTVHVFFPYKCDQLNWHRVLNVEVIATFPDIFRLCCLQ